MKTLKVALIAAFTMASTSVTAAAAPQKAPATAAKVSTCYYEYSILTPDAIYDVYTCYSNGDGSY